MNHAPRFSIGQDVVTPRHGSGVVKWVYPAHRPRARTRYSIAVRGRSTGLVLDEQEIAPKIAGEPGPEVHCRDCVNHTGFVFRNSVRCFVSKQYRMVDKVRVCNYFTPLQPAQGG